jgi:fluoride exporter
MAGSFPPLGHIGAVALGGSVGSILRYFSSYYGSMWLGTTFPYGTLFVNVTGSLWLGFFGTLALNKAGLFDPHVRLLLTTGFAGGFTTFSSLAFETMALYEGGSLVLAMGNIVANVILGMLGLLVGIYLARLI